MWSPHWPAGCLSSAMFPEPFPCTSDGSRSLVGSLLHQRGHQDWHVGAAEANKIHADTGHVKKVAKFGNNSKDGLHKPTSQEDGLHAPMEADIFKDGLHKPTFHEDGLRAPMEAGGNTYESGFLRFCVHQLR